MCIQHKAEKTLRRGLYIEDYPCSYRFICQSSLYRIESVGYVKGSNIQIIKPRHFGVKILVRKFVQIDAERRFLTMRVPVTSAYVELEDRRGPCNQ
jgi:hypothetical protein